MFDFQREKEHFGRACTACGICVEVCPIVPVTDLRTVDPAEVMESVMELYRSGNRDDTARLRIYSCMSCQTCRSSCPEGLDPGLGLSLAREILRDHGDAAPRGLSFLLPETPFNLMKAVEAAQVAPRRRPWITDTVREQPLPSKTVLFTGCTGLMQPDLVCTALDLIRRIDPSVQALGGVDYCCGDTNLRAGNPQGAAAHFQRLVTGLNAFQPEHVVFLCPTCNAFFDMHEPETSWSWSFVTRYLADRVDELGPFSEVRATVALHDACHLVRGEHPESDSPRTLLQAVPGIQIVELSHSRENALCCGGSAMAAVGKPGADFRGVRLQEVRESGAEYMGLYCPGCQSVFAPEGPNAPFRIVSILSLLGRSLGIRHDDVLSRYLGYGDAARVLEEAAPILEETELPKDKLLAFLSKYFRGPGGK